MGVVPLTVDIWKSNFNITVAPEIEAYILS